jgi:hypothetical protein
MYIIPLTVCGFHPGDGTLVLCGGDPGDQYDITYFIPIMLPIGIDMSWRIPIEQWLLIGYIGQPVLPL